MIQFDKTGVNAVDFALANLADFLDPFIGANARLCVQVENLVKEVVGSVEAEYEGATVKLVEVQSELEDTKSSLEDATEDVKLSETKIAKIKADYDAQIEYYEEEVERLQGILNQLVAINDAKESKMRELEASSLKVHQRATRYARELREMAEKYESKKND